MRMSKVLIDINSFYEYAQTTFEFECRVDLIEHRIW